MTMRQDVEAALNALDGVDVVPPAYRDDPRRSHYVVCADGGLDLNEKLSVREKIFAGRVAVGIYDEDQEQGHDRIIETRQRIITATRNRWLVTTVAPVAVQGEKLVSMVVLEQS